MKSLLQTGQFLHGASGMYRIGKLLGSGSQGEVYEATQGGQTYAIKWYFPSMATNEQLHGLSRLAKIGPPNTCFLWPMEVLKSATIKGFGYVMPLRPKRFASIVDLMKRKAEPNFMALIEAAISLVESFHMLHQKHLCYRDISFGNVFFDPKTGEVLICDNDNIAFEGENHVAVLGTPRFMAPEIVRGERLPDVLTDRFSLSVLLFYMFMIHHPLEGRLESSIKCFDLPAMRKLYGEKPVFIFDPIVHTNRPVVGIHDNAIIYWGLYPDHFKRIFVKTFTKGLKIRDQRAGEVEWLKALLRLKHSLVHCSCGAENFYEGLQQDPKANGIFQHRPPTQCWACQKTIPKPLSMVLGNDLVVLTDHIKLYNHQIRPEAPVQLSPASIVAEVTRHPQMPDVKGLKNLTSSPWRVLTSKGATIEVPAGRSCTLEEGVQINFGPLVGHIKA